MLQPIIKLELDARKKLAQDSRYTVEYEDYVHRALGVLQNTKLIGAVESLDLLSRLQLGVYTGLLSDQIGSKISQLTQVVYPMHLQKHAGCFMDIKQRKQYRAQVIKKILFA